MRNAKLGLDMTRREIRQPILDYLATGEKRYAEILHHLDLGDSHNETVTVSIALGRLVATGEIVRVERGLYRLA